MLDTCKKQKYIYFVTGGGTGGHIYPAIAICDKLKEDLETKKIYYVGNPKNLEYDIVSKAGYEFLPVNVSGMPRKLGFGLICWLFQLQFAILKALFYVMKYRPNAIIGTGGYVSAPALFAGVIGDIPLMIHDSDAKPGIVSRYIASNTKAISVAFECAKSYLKSNNISVNGNPIRDAFKTLTKEEARKNLGIKEKTTLCIMGGSQGAKSINSAAVEILKTLSKDYDIQIIFQTGKKKFDDVTKRLKEVYPEYESDSNLMVRPYFDNMTEVLKASDIAVSRAGSLSLSEICACSIASILIPYPHAAADHQRKNARFMEEKRAALYLEDADTTKDTLLIAIQQLLDNKEKLSQIQKNAFALAKLDSTANIVNQLKGIVK
ncbi:MAG: undecaprenyldiphospho-muramoylpentapeptide beta-N-acetylglucosaminyltransferase [bacterium]|nr:undecaprenyldiphospho-muramoylpentapeptide beta-N-acetylglucosaminyltransferase [bacterium]